MRVLLVEDNETLARGLMEACTKAGFPVDHGTDLASASSYLSAYPPDVIVLDLGLPDGSGLDFLRQLRRQKNQTPVLILTAQNTLGDRVEGLDAGADDYMSKPFDLGELLARLRALTRRQAGRTQANIEFGPLSYDVATMVIQLGPAKLPLNRRELACLRLLMERGNQVLSREQLMNGLYGGEDAPGTNALELLVSRLRKHIDHPDLRLKTVRGVGYMLVLEN